MSRRLKVVAGVVLVSLLAPPGRVPADTRPEIAAAPGARRYIDRDWGVELTIPGYKSWDNYPSKDYGSNLLLAAHADGTCSLNLSMFVENGQEGASPEQCVRGTHRYQGNPDLLTGRRDIRSFDHQVAPLTFTRFDQVFDDPNDRISGAVVRAHGPFLQNQLFGYWTRGRYCFELHISSISCPSFAEQAMPILRSVAIGPDTGATLETVELARSMGSQPGDWRLHSMVAKQYMEQKRWADAVPFYRYALAHGGDSVEPVERIDLLTGLGDSLQRFGRSPREGIGLLGQALDEANRLRDAPRAQRALFALAWSQALQGDYDASCGRARELLTALGKKERNETVRQIRESWPCHALHRSECYKALLADLGLKWKQGPWKPGATTKSQESPDVH